MNLEHANLTVRSISEAVKFLGTAFPEASVRGGGALHGDESLGRWIHFGTPENYVALQENRVHSERSDTPYTNDGINHVGFVVTALDDMLRRLSSEGYELSPASSMDGHPQRRRAYLVDGNGIEWEFIEYVSDDPRERNQYDV